jgi:hypothetical protein
MSALYPPFMPPKFVQLPPSQLGGGGATPYSGAIEDGPGVFANPANTQIPVRYTGQDQTSTINTAKPKPATSRGPGPADPIISSPSGNSYFGTGYGQVSRGTIGVGTLPAVTPQGAPAQVRMFLQGNNLIILDNSGTAYVVPATATIPQPGVYSPTK